MKKRILGVAALAVLAVSTLAAPAQAAEVGPFTRGCSVNYVINVATISTGTTNVKVGGAYSEYRTFNNQTAANWWTGQRSGAWYATAPSLPAASATCGP